MRVACCALILAGCGGTPPHPDSVSTFAGDAASLRKLLHGSVTNAGVWFADPSCREQFARAGEIQEPQLDAFAKCLADLHMHTSERRDPLPDVAVLTYAPGLELEALFTERRDGPQVLWIGPTSRRDRADGPLSITPEAIVALRVGTSDAPQGIQHDDMAWIEVCIDDTGAVNRTRALDASTVRAANKFKAAVSATQFQPFVLDGHAVAVCSLIDFPHVHRRHTMLPYPDPPDAHGVERPTTLGGRSLHRISGEIALQPDDPTRLLIQQTGAGGAIGAVQFCIDTQGHVVNARMIRPTGYASYDQDLLEGVKQWKYEPYVEDGVAIPVCAATNFLYHQPGGGPRRFVIE